MTEEEEREELIRLLSQKVISRSRSKDKLIDRLRKDPKAFLTRRKDYVYAARFLTDEEMDSLPALNEI